MFYFFFFWHLYSVLISVFLVEDHTFGYLFMNLTKNFDDVSTFEKIRNFDDSAAQNLIVTLQIWLFSD